jgi:hypothetical protein
VCVGADKRKPQHSGATCLWVPLGGLRAVAAEERACTRAAAAAGAWETDEAAERGVRLASAGLALKP